jgi:hypothetical protein
MQKTERNVTTYFLSDPATKNHYTYLYTVIPAILAPTVQIPSDEPAATAAPNAVTCTTKLSSSLTGLIKIAGSSILH